MNKEMNAGEIVVRDVYGDALTNDVLNSMISYVKKINGLTMDELKEFLLVCKLHNLNPLKREVYAVKIGGVVQIYTNYYEYIKRADASGILEHFNVEIIENDGKPVKAIFVGKRKDWTSELKMTFYYNEWNQNFGLWKTKPFFMFEKVVLANGLRRLFPNELGNMPYITEENWLNTDKKNIISTNDDEKLENIESKEVKLKNVL